MTQLANAAESVADVVGLGWGQLEVAKVVHEADDLLNTDLGAYYAKHQEGVDLVGFLGSSLVPGTIGVKSPTRCSIWHCYWAFYQHRYRAIN